MGSSPEHIACACVPEELFIPPGSNELATPVLNRLGADLEAQGKDKLQVALDGRLAITGVHASTYHDEESKFMVAFTGTLDPEHLADLGKTYLEGREEGSYTPAELVAAMYRVHQPLQVSGRLKGDWALVGFDIMQMRAFGARSCEDIPLYQGKLLNGTIVLTTFDLAQDTSMPLEWKVELTQVPVSHYVFGWRKLQLPIPFHKASDADPPQTPAAAASAAMLALKGLPRLSLDGDGSRRQSLDEANRRQSLDIVSGPRTGDWIKMKSSSRRQSLDGRRSSCGSRRSIDEKRAVRQSIDEKRPVLNLTPIDDERRKELEERRSAEIRRSMEQNSSLFELPTTHVPAGTTLLAPTAAPFQPAASCSTANAHANVQLATKSCLFNVMNKPSPI